MYQMMHVLEKHSDFCFSKSKLIWHFLISYKSQLWVCFILTTKVCFYIHMHNNYSGFLFWHFEPFFLTKICENIFAFKVIPVLGKLYWERQYLLVILVLLYCLKFLYGEWERKIHSILNFGVVSISVYS